MRLVKTSGAVSVLLVLTFVPAYATQGNSGNHGPKTTTPHGASANVVQTKAPKTTSTKPPKTPKVETTKLAKADTKSGSTTTSPTTSGTAPTTTTGTSGTINFTSSPVGQKLSKNTALRSKIETRLTALGYTGTSYQAAYGFKNLGQFVAATNVSQNLGLSFEQLKVQMTGTTVKPDGTVLKANLGTDGKVTMVPAADVTNAAPTKSLGQSIQTVKAGVDGTAAAQTATREADAEIESTTVHK